MPNLARVLQFDRVGAGRAGKSDPPPQIRYHAFLSYSHGDEAMAAWLQDQLERFRVPSMLAGRIAANGVIPKRLTPIFRDRREFAAAKDLSVEIREALSASRFLVVLCSPGAAKSRWTNAEIETFKRLRPEGCVLAAIVAGEPFASDIDGREQEECLPPALRVKYDRRGRPTARRSEPLAADMRASGDGKRLGFLKIVAGMLGVGLDELVQRENLRRQRRLAMLAAGSLAGMVVTSTLALVAVNARDAAYEQRMEAEGLVGFMLGDLRGKLEPLGRLDVLDSVGARALDYYRKQDKESLSDDGLAQRSRALTLMGEIASKRGNLDPALGYYREALVGTAEALRRAPDNAQRVFDHAQSVFWVGSIAWQRGLIPEALAAFREYKRLSEILLAMDPEKAEWRLERIYADTNLGVLLLEQNRHREAAATFRSGLSDIEALAASEPDNRAYQDQLSESLAYLSQAQESSGALDSALAQRERQLKLLEQLALRAGGADAPMQRKTMAAHRAIGRLFASLGDTRQGLAHLEASVAIAEDLMALEPANTEWAQLASSIHLELGELQIASGRAASAGASARTGCDIASRLVDRTSPVPKWQAGLRSDCLALRARVAMARSSHEEARALAAQNVAHARSANWSTPIEKRIAIANAEALRGLLASRTGQQQAARSAFANALAVWPDRVELTPRRLARQVVILRAAGRHEEAAAGAAKLTAMGYRHPSYLNETGIVGRAI